MLVTPHGLVLCFDSMQSILYNITVFYDDIYLKVDTHWTDI